MKSRDKILLNSKEVSRYLSIPIRTLQQLSKWGKIKAIKVGRQWRYKKTDIEKYLSYGTNFSEEAPRFTNFPEGAGSSERRAYPRINCFIPCYSGVVIPTRKEISARCQILNISEGGVFLEECDGGFLKIRRDDPINLEFELDDSGMLNVRGRVARIQDKGIAVRFRRIEEGDRLKIREYIG